MTVKSSLKASQMVTVCVLFLCWLFARPEKSNERLHVKSEKKKKSCDLVVMGGPSCQGNGPDNNWKRSSLLGGESRKLPLQVSLPTIWWNPGWKKKNLIWPEGLRGATVQPASNLHAVSSCKHTHGPHLLTLHRAHRSQDSHTQQERYISLPAASPGRSNRLNLSLKPTEDEELLTEDEELSP